MYRLTGNRIKKALEAGVPYDTIIVGIDLVPAVNAGPTIALATQGADLIKNDEICSDDICTTGVPE